MEWNEMSINALVLEKSLDTACVRDLGRHSCSHMTTKISEKCVIPARFLYFIFKTVLNSQNNRFYIRNPFFNRC